MKRKPRVPSQVKQFLSCEIKGILVVNAVCTQFMFDSLFDSFGFFSDSFSFIQSIIRLHHFV